MKIKWITIILLVLLQGCSIGDRRERPAPVVYQDPAYKSQREEPIVQTAPASPYPEPAPMERYGEVDQPEQTEEVEEMEEQALAYAEPTPASTPAPAFQPNRPVEALVEKADSQSAAGDLSGSAATLERALRIEPRNPHLLNRLARVRLQQGSYDQADSLASKSNALAGDAAALRRDNQEIIAAARKAAGR